MTSSLRTSNWTSLVEAQARSSAFCACTATREKTRCYSAPSMRHASAGTNNVEDRTDAEAGHAESNNQVLNGMSHGAAGFAYALAALATVSGRENFADAAAECLNFERLTSTRSAATGAISGEGTDTGGRNGAMAP